MRRIELHSGESAADGEAEEEWQSINSWRDMSLVRTEHISSPGCVSKKIEMPQKELIFNHGYGLG